MGDSRTTLWRKRKNKLLECTCEFHTSAQDRNHEERCLCVYHTGRKKTRNDCTCPYHTATNTDSEVVKCNCLHHAYNSASSESCSESQYSSSSDGTLVRNDENETPPDIRGSQNFNNEGDQSYIPLADPPGHDLSSDGGSDHGDGTSVRNDENETPPDIRVSQNFNNEGDQSYIPLADPPGHNLSSDGGSDHGDGTSVRNDENETPPDIRCSQNSNNEGDQSYIPLADPPGHDLSSDGGSDHGDGTSVRNDENETPPDIRCSQNSNNEGDQSYIPLADPPGHDLSSDGASDHGDGFEYIFEPNPGSDFEYGSGNDSGDGGGPNDLDDDPDDDPDDPEGDEESGSEGEELMDDDGGGLNLNDEALNEILNMIPRCTKREAIAMVLSLVLRHRLDYESMTKTFLIINTILGGRMLPTTKKQLWNVLHRAEAGIEKHAYCSSCNRYFGIVGQLQMNIVCRCGFSIPRKRVKYFITFSVRKQLLALLKDPKFREWIQYRNRRQKKVPQSLEDILDGQAYHALQLTPYDFSYTFNMDGFKISKSSKNEAWPIFLKINELPLNLRQKYVILAGLWVDPEKLNFNLFMQKFVDQANSLSQHGLVWKPDGINDVTSRFIPTVCCVDAKARAGILNMSEYTGKYSCPICNHIGIKLEGMMKFPLPGTHITRIRQRGGIPYEEHSVIPPTVLRTHASIMNAMVEANDTGRRVEGFIGLSQVMLLNGFDMGSGFSTDDLHPIFNGVTAFHTELLFNGVVNEFPALSKMQICLINARLKNIQTPTHISRKPRPINLMAKWKASEWRNWLFYYAVPCLRNIIPDRYLRHFGLLSRAIFKLSRDIISEDDLQDADACLQEYVATFQALFSPACMRFNVHILLHMVGVVRNWGPLWAHSTFPFESWNHRLAKTVKAGKGAVDQMAIRYLMNSVVENIHSDETISEEVKSVVKFIRDGAPLRNATRVGNAVLFGDSIDRIPSNEETRLLQEEGYMCDMLEEFPRVKVNGVEVRSAMYRADGLSSNNIVYTMDDEFFSVDSIVVYGEPDDSTCGLFVTKFDVGEPLLHVPHIVQIERHVTKAYIPIHSVRNLVVKVKITNELSYIIPMSNQCEID